MTGAALEAPALKANLGADLEADQGVDLETDLGADLEADLESRFGAFVAENAERARRLAWQLVGGDAAAAEDIAQEAFVKSYRSLSRFRGDASLGTWFYRILVREAHNYRRWKAVRDLWGGSSDLEVTDPSPAPSGDPLLRRRITVALDKLTRKQREAFVLVHEEGFTTREVAQMLNRSPGTVKTHLHRALQALRRDLGDLRESTGERTT
jgi:RNA polymerase sigma-70 factor (ECF subfamily)